MLLRRAGLTLGGVDLQGGSNLSTGISRVNHVVDLTAGGGHVRRVERVLVLLDLLGAHGVGIVGSLDLLAEDHICRTLGAHHRNLGAGPGVHGVGTKVTVAHGQVGAAVGLRSTTVIFGTVASE